jgi:hypothetical protein
MYTLYMTARVAGTMLGFLVFAVFFLASASFAHAQSCSISISPQTGATGSGRTLYWSISGSTINLYISNIGWVSGSGNNGADMWTYYFGSVARSGAVTIYPSSHTTYAGSAYYSSNGAGFCTPGYCSVPAWGPVTCSYTAYAYPPASCSVSLSPNPKSYAGSATLSWSSSNAHYWVYINNVGYVGGSGSTTVSPTSSTDYSCYAHGYGASDGWHSYTLTVNPPASCTLPWGGTLAHGGSVTAYEASSVAYGGTCNSQTRSCSNGTLSGSYQYQSCNQNCTFDGSAVSHGSSVIAYQSAVAPEGQTCGSISESRSCSNGSLSGSYTHDSCTVACTPSYSCTGAEGNTITYTAADCTTSTIDTCELPEFCTAGSATCLYNAITGDISASPRLVGSGKSTTISWETTDAESCTVSGTNGDTWSGTNTSRTSSPITQVTQYTLTCDDADPDTTEDDFTDRVTVVRVPGWLEI